MFYAAFVKSDKITLTIIQKENTYLMMRMQRVFVKWWHAHTWQCTYLIVHYIFVVFVRENEGQKKYPKRGFWIIHESGSATLKNWYNCTRHIFNTRYNKIVHRHFTKHSRKHIIFTRETRHNSTAIDCGLKLAILI